MNTQAQRRATILDELFILLKGFYFFYVYSFIFHQILLYCSNEYLLFIFLSFFFLSFHNWIMFFYFVKLKKLEIIETSKHNDNNNIEKHTKHSHLCCVVVAVYYFVCFMLLPPRLARPPPVTTDMICIISPTSYVCVYR